MRLNRMRVALSLKDERLSFAVVGVGASAGGLAAFTQFLQALPNDTGMAFVLVQHLSPSHESALAEILSRATSMPVTEVADEPEIEPNHVYVIPPNRNMTIAEGHLKLFAREKQPRHPIDQFFRSLAQSQRHLAIGVVLSGTATDGTLGLEEIKAEGGITFAQDAPADFDGMPERPSLPGPWTSSWGPVGIAGEIARIASQTPGDGTDQEGLVPSFSSCRPARTSTSLSTKRPPSSFASRGDGLAQ
jgi:two-component system CheB/CheR fusion protein